MHVFLAQHPQALAHVDVASVHVQRLQKLPVIYAVNFQQGGFALVSADDCVRPVLGLCYQGKYDPAIHVDGLDWLQAEWALQIQHIVSNKIPATPEIAGEWVRWQSDAFTQSACDDGPMASYLPPIIVSPLLGTTWNQGCYYNADCPADGGGSCGRVWTGCGATAMAQSMKYHAWPATGVGSHSYTPPSYALQSANYGATTYNWGAMPAAVSAANPAVAQLMHQCGVALDMNYGTTESTCYFTSLSDAMKRYFRYSLSTQGRSKLMYTDAQWDVVLRTELDASRIVPYNGGAHIWVCDGYQTSPDLYHMNWGWGGTYNGYYAQNSLNPGSLTFATVSCIVGMQPVGAFEVEGDSAVFGENAGTATVEVAGDSNWTAAASVAWIGVSLGGGAEGYFQPVISVAANPGYPERTGFVAFQRGLLHDTVWVRQAGITPRLSVSPTPIAEGAAGGSRTLSVNCDSAWVVTFADAWISYAPGSGVGNGSVGITIASNPGAGLRTGTIVFTRGSIARTVTINQDGTSAFWCVPVLGTPAAVGATNVNVKTINRTSSISEGYVLAPDSTILKRDSTYTIRVTFSGSVAPAIWADWNQDGDFFDASEAIVAPSGSWYPTFGGTKTTTFAVPATAVLGQTRLRVYVKTFSGGPTTGPCATASVGDIEDYNIYIQPSTTLPADEFVLALDADESTLRWTWDSPAHVQQFEVQWEQDGQWQALAMVDGRDDHWQRADGLAAGRYRVAALLVDGQRTYSNVVEQRRSDLDAPIHISPNPVAVGSSFRLHFPSSSDATTLRIWDTHGRLVRTDALADVGLCYVSTDGWAAGTYLLQVHQGHRVQTLRVVVQ
jgi:hypothetical protein